MHLEFSLSSLFWGLEFMLMPKDRMSAALNFAISGCFQEPSHGSVCVLWVNKPDDQIQQGFLPEMMSLLGTDGSAQCFCLVWAVKSGWHLNPVLMQFNKI